MLGGPREDTEWQTLPHLQKSMEKSDCLQKQAFQSRDLAMQLLSKRCILSGRTILRTIADLLEQELLWMNKGTAGSDKGRASFSDKL